MFRKAAIAALALMFLAPSVILLGIGALMNPAAANCAVSTMCAKTAAAVVAARSRTAA